MLIDCSAKLPADVTEAMFRTMEQQALGQVCSVQKFLPKYKFSLEVVSESVSRLGFKFLSS